MLHQNGMPGSKNALSWAQRNQLVTFIQQHLSANCPKLDKWALAEQASKQLEYTVSHGNINGVIRDAAIDYPIVHRPNPTRTPQHAAMMRDRYRATHGNLNAKVRLLEDTVAYLCDCLRVKPEDVAKFVAEHPRQPEES